MSLIRRDLPVPNLNSPPRDRASAWDGLRYARERDPLGHRIHAFMAAAYVLLLPLLTGGKDAAFILLAGYAILRLPNTWRAYRVLLREPLVWAALGWAVWQGLAILWSENPDEGLNSLKVFRVILTPLVLWPVLDRFVMILLAFLIGVLMANAVQFMQGLSLFGLSPADDDRLRGLIHPIQLATMCTAAIVWHLSILLNGGMTWCRSRPWWALFTVIGLLAACIGLVFTGSRGPWIAAGITLPVMLLVLFLRRPAARRTILVVLMVGVLGAAAAWPFAGSMVTSRVQQALTEVREARSSETYATSAGLRLMLWTWAIRFWQDSPVIGIGAGAYREAQHADPDFQRLTEGSERDRDYISRHHAHSTYLHVLACEGAIGALLMLTVFGLVAVRAWRHDDPHPYTDGVFFALLAWLIGAQFDAFHGNGHLFGLFWLFAAFALPWRLRADDALPWPNTSASEPRGKGES